MSIRLNDYLRGKQPQGFHPIPHYFADGDFLTYYLRDVPHFAERLDDVVTVYLARDTKELVGCKVKGVRAILKAADSFGIAVDGGSVKLGVFLFAGSRVEQPAQPPRVKWYERLAELADVTIDAREFQVSA